MSEDNTTLYPDCPTDKDQLGREDFAAQLAQTIRNYRRSEPFVVGIIGPWGIGKSSFLKLLLKEFNQETDAHHDSGWLDKTPYLPNLPSKILWPPPMRSKLPSEFQRLKKSIPPSQHWITVEFNPWLIEKRSHLIERFLEILANELGRHTSGGTLSSLTRKLRKYASALKNIPSNDFGSRVLKSVGEFVAKSPGTRQNLIRLKREISETLQESDIKILVTIDDIDRLSFEDIASVFQLLGVVADFQNTLFVVAFDDRIISTALKEVHGEHGPEFIEKIVQLPIHLPDITESQLKRLFNNWVLKPVLAKTQEQNFSGAQRHFTEDFWNAGLEQLVDTMRELKRLQNIIPFRYESIANEVSPINFIVLETLRLQHNEAFQFIRARPNLTNNIVQKDKYKNGPESAEKKKERRVKELREEVENEAARAVIRSLFPYHYKVGPRGSLRDKPIQDEKYFPKYFTLDTPSDVVSDVQFDQKWRRLQELADQTDMANWLIEKTKKIGDFFYRINSRTSTKFDINIAANLLQLQKIFFTKCDYSIVGDRQAFHHFSKCLFKAIGALKFKGPLTEKELFYCFISSAGWSGFRYITQLLEKFIKGDRIISDWHFEDEIKLQASCIQGSARKKLKELLLAGIEFPGRPVHCFVTWDKILMTLGYHSLGNTLERAPDTMTRDIGRVETFLYFRQYFSCGKDRKPPLTIQEAFNKLSSNRKSALKTSLRNLLSNQNVRQKSELQEAAQTLL